MSITQSFTAQLSKSHPYSLASPIGLFAFLFQSLLASQVVQDDPSTKRSTASATYPHVSRLGVHALPMQQDFVRAVFEAYEKCEHPRLRDTRNDISSHFVMLVATVSWRWPRTLEFERKEGRIGCLRKLGKERTQGAICGRLGGYRWSAR